MFESLLITGANGFVGQSVLDQIVSLPEGQRPRGITVATRREFPKINWFISQGLNINWTLCDCSSRALEVAQQNAHAIGEHVNLLRVDLLREQLPARADVVICSLFMHHLDHDTGQTVMRTMASSADVAVGIADLDRSNAGLALAWIGSRVLTRSRVVHFDAIASVRAAFTLDEARAIAHEAGLHGASVSRAWPARWRLWWQRPSARAVSEVSL